MVGIALIPGYLMLGSTYLIIKTTGTVQERAYKEATWSGLAVLGFMAVVTVWTPFHYPLVWTHWFSPPRIYFVWAFPLMGLIASYKLMKNLKARREILPLVCSILLFLSGYLGLATPYPYAILRRDHPDPRPRWSHALRALGAVIVLPFVLPSHRSCWFRGKVSENMRRESSITLHFPDDCLWKFLIGSASCLVSSGTRNTNGQRCHAP
jgi:cytochrome d ubiquinol oxidase subunit II